MENNSANCYDSICIGRFANVLVKDGKRFNQEMNKGVDCNQYLAFEKNEYNYFHSGKTPFLVYEYEVNGVQYRRAHIAPRNSRVIQETFFGKECVVVYSSVNPGISKINTNISVENAKAQYNLVSPTFVWNTVGVDQEKYKDYTEYETTSLEITALILGIVSLIPCGPFLGWLLGPAAVIVAIISLTKPKRNRPKAVTALILGIVGILMSLVMVLLVVFPILAGQINY